MKAEIPTAVLDQVFDPIARCLTPEVARNLVALRADPEMQAQVEALAEKCNEGQLTSEERAEYEAYIRAVHFLTVLQSKARALLARSAAL